VQEVGGYELSFLLLASHSDIMAPKGDEHPHHPLCGECGEEFTNVEQLTEHVDNVHRQK